jgi:preprotein translocase subunit SecY
VKRIQVFLNNLATNKELRTKLIFTLAIFLIYRFLSHIPVPSVDIESLQNLFAGNQFLSFLNVFSGGQLSRFSIMAVGISPFITASIIMQLAGMVFPQLKELQKDGESGREKVNQYTRLLSVPFAVVQSISVLTLLNSQNLIQTSDPITIVAMIMSMVAGAMVIMWLGELITLYGLGNGISMILVAGIISELPTSLAQAVASSTGAQQITTNLVFGIVFVLVIGLIVFMNEAIRKVSIQYAKRVRGSRMSGGESTHLPIRVNVAGVMPIIFAVSIMLAPSFIGNLLVSTANTSIGQSIGETKMIEWGTNLQIWFTSTSVIYMLSYFLVVFIFTYFSALIFFNTGDISDELKKSGAFIPGTRPGGPTKKYLEFVVTRITLVGAIFLGFIAILPSLAQRFTGVGSLAIGGTSVLIVVSVILETAKQVESMLVGQHYDKYL